MGMFDEVNQQGNPCNLPSPKDNWQSKSLDCNLDIYQISRDGILSLEAKFGIGCGERDRTNIETWQYTGWLNFYSEDAANDKWRDFDAYLVNNKICFIKEYDSVKDDIVIVYIDDPSKLEFYQSKYGEC